MHLTRDQTDDMGALAGMSVNRHSSGVTAALLRGGATQGGEMMAWRRKAAEDKKRHGGRQQQLSQRGKLPPVSAAFAARGKAGRSIARRNQLSAAPGRLMRDRVLQQLGIARHRQRSAAAGTRPHGYCPPSSNGQSKKPGAVWFDFSGNRSSVPRMRSMDSLLERQGDGALTAHHLAALSVPAPSSQLLRNDGWDGIGEEMSDTLSCVADDVDDLDVFYRAGFTDPADAWVDEETGRFAAALHADRRAEAREPLDRVTGIPKGAGVTEGIDFLKKASRRGSVSRQGRMMRV